MEGDSSVENIKNEDPTDQASKEETETDNKSEKNTCDQNIEKQPVHETNSSMADTSIEREVPKQENKSEMIERKGKVDVLLKAAGDAPIMKKKKWAVESNKTVAYLTQFIRKYIKCEPDESLFLYVNQTFVPSPDQVLSNLFDCFGTDGKLVLHYCKTQAWG